MASRFGRGHAVDLGRSILILRPGMARAAGTCARPGAVRAGVCRPGRRVVAAASLRLYGSRGSRSPLVDWYLHEIGVAFERASPRDEGNPHPMGQVPALRDGDEVEVWESGAILSYIADAYGSEGGTPASRAELNKWLVWANATLDPVLFKETPDGKVYDTGVRSDKPPRALAMLEDHLGGEREWILDSGFSAADCAIGAYLLYILMFFPDASYARYPAIARYMERCASREAYAQAFEEDTAQALAARCRAFLASEAKPKAKVWPFG